MPEFNTVAGWFYSWLTSTHSISNMNNMNAGQSSRFCTDLKQSRRCAFPCEWPSFDGAWNCLKTKDYLVGWQALSALRCSWLHHSPFSSFSLTSHNLHRPLRFTTHALYHSLVSLASSRQSCNARTPIDPVSLFCIYPVHVP